MKEIPEEVRQFVIRHFQSVGELEISLFLNDNPGREWTASEISTLVQLDRSLVETLVQRLVSAKLVLDRDLSGQYVYRADQSDISVHAMLNELGKWYSTHRVRVLDAIYGNPIDRIQTFVHALRLRHEKE